MHTVSTSFRSRRRVATHCERTSVTSWIQLYRKPMYLRARALLTLGAVVAIGCRSSASDEAASLSQAGAAQSKATPAAPNASSTPSVEAPAAAPRAVGKQCGVLCERTAELKCSTVEECRKDCESRLQRSRCPDELTAFLECLVTDPSAHFECAGGMPTAHGACEEASMVVSRCIANSYKKKQ